MRTTAGKKIGEMQSSLRLYGEVDRAAALQLLDTDIGQRAMTDLRHQLRDLYDAESKRLAMPGRARIRTFGPRGCCWARRAS